MYRALTILGAGAVGALTLTLLNEKVRRMNGRAPRLDKLGERTVLQAAKWAGVKAPRGRKLRRVALGADLLTNGLFYALVAGFGRHRMARGLGGGLLAGAAAIFLPRLLGFGVKDSGKTQLTRVLTMAWYTLGGLATAGASSVMRPSVAPGTN